jgi:hypothetical protein
MAGTLERSKVAFAATLKAPSAMAGLFLPAESKDI